MFAFNMAVDTPKQSIGHIDSSRKQGVTNEELLNVGIMVRTIAELHSVKLKSWEAIMEKAESDELTSTNPYEV